MLSMHNCCLHKRGWNFCDFGSFSSQGSGSTLLLVDFCLFVGFFSFVFFFPLSFQLSYALEWKYCFHFSHMSSICCAVVILAL